MMILCAVLSFLYAGPAGLHQTPEETMAARLAPIDQSSIISQMIRQAVDRGDKQITLPSQAVILKPIRLPSGLKNFKILGATGGTALVGGLRIGNWQRLTAGPEFDRIPAEGRDKIYVSDLRALGISDFGALRQGGFGYAPTAPLELFWGDKPMEQARYPSRGWLRTTLGAGRTGFQFQDAGPGSWSAENMTGANRVMVVGYIGYGDFDDYSGPLTELRADSATVATPVWVNIKKGRRFAFTNVLEALDQPGEYYVDRNAAKIYFYPPGPIDSAQCYVSVLSKPFLAISGASKLLLKDISFAACRDVGVRLEASDEVTIQGCSFLGIGTTGIEFGAGVSHSTIIECDFQDGGGSSVKLRGGERRTLSSGSNSVEICTFERGDRRARSDAGFIRISGVGLAVSDCSFSECPGVAIIAGDENTFETRSINNCVFQGNTFSHIATESGDIGAIYLGRDWTCCGNIFRYNLFKDINPVANVGPVSGIYLDDMVSGNTVERNVFVNVYRAVFIGGGRENKVLGNAFLNCTETAVMMDDRGKGWAHESVSGVLRLRLEEAPYRSEPWSTQYPWLQSLLDDDPGAPKNNVISDNLFEGTPWRAWNFPTARVAQTGNARAQLGIVVQGGKVSLSPTGAAAKKGFALPGTGHGHS